MCAAGRFCSQVLSDVVESLVGAVYVDSCGDLDTAWAVAQVRCRAAGRACSFPPAAAARSSLPCRTAGANAGSVDCRFPFPLPCPLLLLPLAPPLQTLLDPLVTPDTLPVHPIRKLQVGAYAAALNSWQPSASLQQPAACTQRTAHEIRSGLPGYWPAACLLPARRPACLAACRRSWCSAAA